MGKQSKRLGRRERKNRPSETQGELVTPPGGSRYALDLGLAPRPLGILLSVLLVVAMLPYVRTWSYGIVFLDDYTFVSNGYWFFRDWANAPMVFTNDVWEFFGRESSLYRPMLLLPRFVVASLFGESPQPYHVANTVLHGLSVAALFLLVVRLVGHAPTAFATALLFALHPAHVPAVAWIEGFNNTLLALFLVTTMLCVLYARQTERPLWAILSGVAFLLALLTKESAVVAPGLAVGILWLDAPSLFRRGSPVGPRVVRQMAAAWAAALLTWLILRSFAISSTPELGAEHVFESVRRGWTGVLLYWGKVFMPFNLATMPVLPDSTLVFGVAAAVGYGALLYGSRGRERRALVLGAVWFLLLISPSLLVSRLEAPSGAIFREDRMYQATMGVFLALAFPLRRALERWRTAAMAATAICAAGALGIGQARVGDYAGGMAFWKASVENSPHLAMAHQLLAAMYKRDGDLPAARASLDRAIALNPRLEGIHNDVGFEYMEEGAYEAADAQFVAELANYPGSTNAHFNRGLLMLRTDRPAQARTHFEEFLRLTDGSRDTPLRAEARSLLKRLEGMEVTRSASDLEPPRPPLRTEATTTG